MDEIIKALIAGTVFGLLAAATMIRMDFGGADKKRDAVIAAFLDRFAIGFLIPLITLPIPHIITGLCIGLLLSLPSAIITRAYVPILIIGTIGGAIIGFLS